MKNSYIIIGIILILLAVLGYSIREEKLNKERIVNQSSLEDIKLILKLNRGNEKQLVEMLNIPEASLLRFEKEISSPTDSLANSIKELLLEVGKTKSANTFFNKRNKESISFEIVHFYNILKVWFLVIIGILLFLIGNLFYKDIYIIQDDRSKFIVYMGYVVIFLIFFMVIGYFVNNKTTKISDELLDSNLISEYEIPYNKMQGKIIQVFITKSNVNLRKGPNTSAKKITTIPKASEVTIIDDNNDGWYEIKFRDYQGFVSKDFIIKQ